MVKLFLADGHWFKMQRIRKTRKCITYFPTEFIFSCLIVIYQDDLIIYYETDKLESNNNLLSVYNSVSCLLLIQCK